MLNITEQQIREAYEAAKVSIKEISLVVDPATHEKYNVITEINGARTAQFIWDEQSLDKELTNRVEDRGVEERRLHDLMRRLKGSTALQSRPLR